MSHYLEEAMGVNHAEQQEHRQWLESAAAGEGGDDLYDLPGSAEFAQSPEMNDGEGSADNQADAGSSRGSMLVSDDGGGDSLPPLFSSSRLEPSAHQQASLRRENQVPLAFMGEVSTSSRNEGLHRAGIHPDPRPVPAAHWENLKQARTELRPLTRQARAVGSARDAVLRGLRGRLQSATRWGRFKDNLRGSKFFRVLGMSSHRQVQARRLKRLLGGRMPATQSTSQFAALAAKGTSAFAPGTGFDRRWGGLKPTAGAAIPEVEGEDEID